MFGKILAVTNTTIAIENLTKKVESTLIGVHIVFEDNKFKVAAEITNIRVEAIDTVLCGEFINSGLFRM